VAERVAGDDASVTNVTPPAAEPHDIELTSRQVIELSEADLIVYVGGGFQPSVEDVADDAAERALDVSEAGGPDPHVWLDPIRLADIGVAIADRLEEIDPGSGYRARAEELAEELEALDEAFQAGLEDCDRRELVTSHEAFGYLADRYELDQIGIAGIDSETEPSPQELADVADFVRENDVKVIFFEHLLPRDLAETIAAETGARTAALDPLESPPDGDYISAMRANLDALRRALGCR
jgi:zinc transport system substrate-binding protein